MTVIKRQSHRATMAISLLEQPFLVLDRGPLVAAAQRASIFPFPGRGMDRSAVLSGWLLTPGNGKGQQ